LSHVRRVFRLREGLTGMAGNQLLNGHEPWSGTRTGLIGCLYRRMRGERWRLRERTLARFLLIDVQCQRLVMHPERCGHLCDQLVLYASWAKVLARRIKLRQYVLEQFGKGVALAVVCQTLPGALTGPP